MTDSPAGFQWRARTVEVTDPGPLDRYVTEDAGLAWIRRGDGLVGSGVVARFETRSIREADAWWTSLCQRIEIETEMPGEWGTGPLAFGSFVFDPDNTTATSRLVVPRTILGRRKGKAWLTTVCPVATVNHTVPEPGGAPREPVGVTVVGSGLSRQEWMDRVAAIVARIEAGEVAKVVLARSVQATAEEPLDVRWLVHTLRNDYPTCWTYLVEGLVGASPEMLVRRESGLVTSRVLAGTIARTGSEESDLKLASSLARSSKNLVEHEIAVESVAEALAPFCSGMNVPESPFVLELANVMHLASDVTGVAKPEVSALALAAQLHPTAAVCGSPTDLARELIAQYEDLDRGRYAGPVGWIDAQGDGEFAIALRCGQLDADDPRRITLFAGCGIVAGSDPAEEFAETLAKLEPMLGALDVR